MNFGKKGKSAKLTGMLILTVSVKPAIKDLKTGDFLHTNYLMKITLSGVDGAQSSSTAP